MQIIHTMKHSYKYLGLWYQDDGKWNEQCYKIKKLLNHKLHENKTFWKNNQVLPAAKFKIFKACCMSGFMYGSTIIDPTKKELTNLDITVNGAIKQVLRFNQRCCTEFIRLLTNTMPYNENSTLRGITTCNAWLDFSKERYCTKILGEMINWRINS